MLRLLLIAVTLGCSTAFAELQWENPAQNVTRMYSDQSAEFHFPFKNAGNTPITVKEVRTSCECTTSRLDKATYAPGEKGEVIARINFEGRMGTHNQTVKVFCSDFPNHPQILNLQVKVIDPLTVMPRLVYWRVGENAAPKKVDIIIDKGWPIRVTSATSSNPKVLASLETVKPGEQYAVKVTPETTAEKASAEITIQTDYPPAAPRSVTIQMRIK